ncbi:MAG: hypothetical protein PHQ95_01620 [Candidatus Gracilibacteria bacterium]|nr:hypothetical protein [Candidatus Gracilibacteria bacterium]
MKTKILIGGLIAVVTTAGTLTYAANISTGATNTVKNTLARMHLTGSGEFNKEHFNKMDDRNTDGLKKMNFPGQGGFIGKGPISQLTDAEKAELATMTNTEKQAFFEAKMTEQKALHDAKEAVIDKLINGEILSDSEKATLAIIKTERDTAKTERLAREKQITELKPIMEKMRAGTSLTTDEQAKLDAFRATMPQGNKKGQDGKNERRSGMMGR